MSVDKLTSLKVALYYSEVKFSYFYPFKKYLISITNDESQKDKIKPSLKLLMERDIESLKEVESNLADNLIERTYDDLVEWFDEFNMRLAELFPGYEKPNLFICDDYPGVFAGKTSSAIHVDQKEETELGVKKGIYIPRKNTNHPFFEITIAHELIHHIVATYSEQRFRYVSFFEEGFCDYLSYYFLLKFKYLKPLALKTYLNNSRYYNNENLTLESYYKFSMLVLRKVNNIGIQKVIDVIIKKGRQGLEASLQEDRVISYQKDVNQSKLLGIFIEVSSGQVISPDEYLLLEYLIENEIHEFEAEMLNPPKEIENFKQSIDRLVQRSLIKTLHGKYHNSFQYMPHNLRYDNSY